MEQPDQEELVDELFQERDGWVSDDIVRPTRWFNVNIDELNLPDGIFTENIKIRKIERYQPKNIVSESKIVWVLIHGTWGDKTSAFFKPNDRKDQNYRHIKRAAAGYASIKSKELELLSYKWTGSWSEDARKSAAKKLNKFFRHMEFDENVEIVVLAHSHGCNIANYLTHLASPERPIHLLIYFACPRKRNEHYQPKNYVCLLYFFSDADWTCIGGRADETETVTLALELGFEVFSTMHQRYCATKDMTVGLRVLDIGFKGAFIAAYRLAWGSGAVKGQQFKKLCDGCNEFLTTDQKITVGYRTKINGSNPGHSQLLNISKWLLGIIQKTQEYYLDHYSSSGTFHLNLDEQDPNPICLVLFDSSGTVQPENFEYLAAGSDKGTVFETDDIPHRRAMREERQFSTQEAHRFLAKYQRAIESNEDSIEQIVHENFNEGTKPTSSSQSSESTQDEQQEQH